MTSEMTTSLSAVASAKAEWAMLIGLGAFHGINPGMGWLFAVALGMQERRRGAVVRALVPLGAGHALAVAGAVGAALAIGAVIPRTVPELRTLAITKSADSSRESDEGGGLKNRCRSERKSWIGQVLISRTLSVCGEVAEKLKAAVC